MRLNVARFLTKVVLFLAITSLMIEFDCFGMLFEKTEKGEALKRRGELLARAHVVKLHRQSQEKKITKELLSSEFQQTKDNPITWVQTQDGDIKEIDTWKIQQMRALHLLLLHQRGKNSKDEPVNASTIIRSWPLTLVSNAFDHLANGTFDTYYDDLKTEYDKTLKKKGKEEFGEGLSTTSENVRFLIKLKCPLLH